jgi:hypothetical protein
LSFERPTGDNRGLRIEDWEWRIEDWEWRIDKDRDIYVWKSAI